MLCASSVLLWRRAHTRTFRSIDPFRARWVQYFALYCAVYGESLEFLQVTRIDASESAEMLARSLQDIQTRPLLPSPEYMLKTAHPDFKLNWFSVACGGFHTCAIKRYSNLSKAEGPPGAIDNQNPDDAPGQLFCWGMNKYGQTDAPKRFGEPLECEVDRGLYCFDHDDGWRNLSTGWLHTCGIQADGKLFCWGNNR